MSAETMSMGGVEHAVQFYDDDTGSGMALCGKAIGPSDLGPRFGKIGCEECREKARAAEVLSELRAYHDREWIDPHRGLPAHRAPDQARRCAACRLIAEAFAGGRKA